MAEEVGVAYVRLIPSMKGFRKAIERELGGLGGPARDHGKKIGDGVGDGVDDSFKGRSTRLGQTLARGIGKGLTAGLKLIAATAAAGFGAQFAGALGSALVSGGKAIAQGLGAAVALAPAAALAGVAAFGALKLAVAGVGDALTAGLSGDVEAFDEALKGLSPSAAAFAREVVGLKGGLDGLKSTVQENFFAPLVDDVRPLVDAYLPQIEGLLGGISRTFGQTASSIVSFLTVPDIAKGLAGAFLNVGDAVNNVALGVGSLVQAFVPLVVVGSSFLPQLTAGFGGLTARVASFMAEAQRTGELAAFIQTGIDSLQRLWATAQQVGAILGNVGSIISTVWAAAGVESGNLLGTIESLTGRFAAFLESARGSAVLGEIFGVLGTVVGGFMDNAGQVFGVLGDVLGPLMPQLGEFLEAFIELKSAVLDVGLEALKPVLMGIGAVLAGVVLPALTGLATFLAQNKPVLQGIGIAITTLLIPAFVGWAISAGTAAVATIAAMLPIILLGAAIAGLAALVIIHFDTIKRWISNVFNWVKDNWPLLLAILTGPIGIAVLLITSHWDTIKAGFTAVKDWIGARIGDVVGFFTGLPGRLSSAAGDLWGWIADSFKGAINTIVSLWNNFSIPSITIGGYDIPGPGPNVPSFTTPTINTPNIPYLARGAIATGPTLAMVGEGGEDEAIAPLSRLQSEIAGPIFDAVAAAGAPVQAGGATVVISGGGLDRRLLEWLRYAVRVQGGGDVQVALGQADR